MKTTWPILALALCAGFAQATPPAGPHEGHAAAAASDAHAHHHTHADHHGHVQTKVHAHVPPAAPHDADAAKWAPDAPLMTGMRRLHAALEGGQHHGAHAAGDPAHALQLASRIDAAVAYMFEHCALPPEPDVALHGVLARMMAGAQALRDDPADMETPLTAMRDAIADYPRLFDDPAFPAATPAHPQH